MVAFAITPEAMASMIACRLDPLPEMRMTSLRAMIGERVFFVCQLPQSHYANRHGNIFVGGSATKVVRHFEGG